ncbi:hypothetical protein M408DRAFT_30369, partial [Serendipita vermifera MAFF 305830]
MNDANYPLVIGVGGLLITTVLWSQLRKKSAVMVGEPPMLPGGLPVIGHAISLVRDANALHMYARQWTRDLQPVSISLVGQRAYFILNPRDWATVWKAKTLSFDALVEGGLVAMFGVTAKGVQELQSDPDGIGPLLQHNHAYLKEVLGPGGSLEPLTRGYIDYLDIELQKEVSGSGIEVKLENW